MPRRTDIETILILGSGPIVIGQASEFDYSGVQACKALRREGYRVVLVNSNPATIMTDPEFADATYVEPLTPVFVEKVIAHERPDALLPTLGGQTGLNVGLELAESGALAQYGVELIGAGINAIRVAEDRRLFSDAMAGIGLDVAASVRATSVDDARAFAGERGFPLLVRSSFTLGGAGSGIARDLPAYLDLVAEGIAASPIGEVQIDESLLGWKEYELEVMRDRADNCVVICSIENVDAMGVHTGDSVTVAPAQTLTDVEYQRMRDAAFAVMRRVGVETGGSNVQFAVDPRTGRQVVIEMNPRVSRSSALASKATGFPIAKIAALLAVGYTLDEIPNDITRETLAAFEPSIDYVVVKIPRFPFEKFPQADHTLTTRMKSVGEVMAIGRTFKEAVGKALRSLENGTVGFVGDRKVDDDTLRESLRVPHERRLLDVDAALSRGWSVDTVADLSAFDPWFVDQILQVVEVRREVRARETLSNVDAALLRRAKRAGLADAVLSRILSTDESAVRARRRALGVQPVFKTVDSCAAEFEAFTPY
ncbi:MAG: carbamoyl-phosphate synthase large subunit, partial [Nitriliruptorales bacterium]|nr:carbamoyl-phosphate synthase large subunit [Nitriliruptorales bacterium]